MDQDILKDFSGIHLHQLENAKRTEGDGMENTNDDHCVESSTSVKMVQEKKAIPLRDRFIYNPEDFKAGAMQPPKITGKIIQLRPAPIVAKSPKHEQASHSLHAKEPKFVPYEPYKGAVNPMVPQEKTIRKRRSKKMSWSSLPDKSINENVIAEKDEPDLENQTNNDIQTQKYEALEKEMERLQKENQQLENQLKFQIQVNGDLKNLLVASVGEDMQTRVHILTEDKLHLARALLNSAQKLNTHQEQTEWLAGQCEVWRSKFLASSIMVEELAKWKALLTRRVQDLQDMSKHLLEERTNVRDYLINTYKDMRVLCDNFDVTSLRAGVHKLKSSNILELSEVNMQLSAIVRLQLLGSGLVHFKPVDPGSIEPKTTRAEAVAIELLKHSVPELENADAAYSAVMGAAVALNSPHLFSPACCGHCTGQIKTV